MGCFELKLLDANGKDDAYFQKAIKGGYVLDVLDDLKVERELRGQNNMIFDNMTPYIFNRTFTSAPAAPGRYAQGGTASAALAFINLNTISSTPSYTENWEIYNNNSYDTIHKCISSANTASGSKRYEEDQITGWQIWSDANREAIHFRNRWLWTTTQGTSNNINSLAIHFHSDGDFTGDYFSSKCRIGRVRLKDAAGIPATLNKTSSQVLLVEYTFTLVTW